MSNTSRGAGTNRTIKATILNPATGTTKTGRVYKLTAHKDGVLGKEVNTNYKVFRPWSQAVFLTVITASTRFNIETAGMTADEVTAYLNELKYNG